MSAVAQFGLPLGTESVLFRIIGANMNITTDQIFTKVGSFTNFLITEIRATNASASLALAVGGVYTAASKGGNAIVAASQVYSVLTGATVGLSLTRAGVGNGVQTTAAPYLSLTTGNGSAATADVYIIGIALT